MKNQWKLLATFLVVFLFGCAAPMKAPIEADADAKIFNPIKDKAAVFVYRNENFGGAVGMPVKVNGLDIGETGAKTFFRLNLSAGTYLISSEAENTSQLQIPVVQGRNYYVWQEVRMGIWKARSSLRLVDEKTGMEGVLESVLLTPKVTDEMLSKSVVVKK